MVLIRVASAVISTVLLLHPPSTSNYAEGFSSTPYSAHQYSPYTSAFELSSRHGDRDRFQEKKYGDTSISYSSRGRGERRSITDEPPKNNHRTSYRTNANSGGNIKRQQFQPYLNTAVPDRDETSNSQSSSVHIDCPHFGTCPGCVVNTSVAEIEVAESAKLYFSSLSVQKHIIGRKGYFDEDFYKVIVPGSITKWRSQAKLAVAPTSNWSRSSGATIGLYARHSHNVLSIPECKVHHPSINRAVEMVVEATKKVRTPVYIEDTEEGLLRYIQLQVELSTGKVCLTLVMNAEKLKQCQPHLSYLVKELKRMDDKREVWHSIWCHCNDSAGNAVFARDSSRWHPIEGLPYIREKIPGSDPNAKEGLLYFSPKVFRQGNYDGFCEIAQEVREAIPRGSKVCELYAGVGLLGLSALLYHGKNEADGGSGGGLEWVRCSDENPENERCFQRAVDSMPMHITGRTPKSFQDRGGDTTGGNKLLHGKKKEPQHGTKDMTMKDLVEMMASESSDDIFSKKNPSDRVTYLVANAASALYQGQALGADALIVDPPRKGLDDSVLQLLCQPYNSKQPYVESATMLYMPRHTINWVNDVRTLIYVSCGFDALARDCDALLSSNAKWKIESATGYVLFPGSNHVESVVVFRR